MTRFIAVFTLMALLSACGVDGPPVPPRDDAPERPEPGISISGTASIGYAGRTTRVRQ